MAKWLEWVEFFQKVDTRKYRLRKSSLMFTEYGNIFRKKEALIHPKKSFTIGCIDLDKSTKNQSKNQLEIIIPEKSTRNRQVILWIVKNK